MLQGFNLAHGTSLTFFDAVAMDPSRQQRYSQAMSWLNAGPGLEPKYVLDNYPWHTLGEATVVDIGGAYGHVSIALSQRFPALTCIVQDQPEVVATGQSLLAQSGLSNSQVSFMEHDFFTEQPLREVDIFYLRTVLHDWSDVHAIRILRALIPALKPSSRILINEQIIPESSTTSSYLQKHFRYGNSLRMLLRDWFQ